MSLKDSATATYSVEPQMLTVSILKEGVVDVLKSLANMKLIKLETAGHEPNAETIKAIEETNAGMGIAKFKSVKNLMADLRN